MDISIDAVERQYAGKPPYGTSSRFRSGAMTGLRGWIEDWSPGRLSANPRNE